MDIITITSSKMFLQGGFRMGKTTDFKVEFMRSELHKQLERCTSLTDTTVVITSQLLDEFIVESQRQQISKNYQNKIAYQM